MTRHLMLDIETLGTKPGCVVLSVGAATFDPTTLTITPAPDASIPNLEGLLG